MTERVIARRAIGRLSNSKSMASLTTGTINGSCLEEALIEDPVIPLHGPGELEGCFTLLPLNSGELKSPRVHVVGFFPSSRRQLREKTTPPPPLKPAW